MRIIIAINAPPGNCRLMYNIFMRPLEEIIENRESPRLFLIADTHFGHENIIKYCSRPFKGADEMDSIMIRNWNSVVGADDVVIHLGDFALAGKEQVRTLLLRLNGRKRLIMGNHDWSNRRSDDGKKFRDPGFYREAGFDEVYDQAILLGHYVLSHEPVDIVSPASCFGNIYGHIHDDERYHTVTKGTVCMCVERWNYTPVLFQDVIEAMQEAAAKPHRPFPERKGNLR